MLRTRQYIGFREPESRNIGGIEFPAFALPVFSVGQDVQVKTRCDKMPATSENWNPSTDGKAIFAPKPASLAKQLLTGSQLLVEAIPKYKGAINMEFEVCGFKWALMPHSGLQALIESTARGETSNRPAVR